MEKGLVLPLKGVKLHAVQRNEAARPASLGHASEEGNLYLPDVICSYICYFASRCDLFLFCRSTPFPGVHRNRDPENAASLASCRDLRQRHGPSTSRRQNLCNH